MAKEKRRDYSTEETLKMMQTVMGAIASGQLQSTVFSAPQDASTYDSVAATANGMVNHLVGKYANQMIAQQVFQKTHAVSSVLGAGTAGANLLNTLRSFDPSLSDRILGLSGMTEASQSAILNANGIAAAAGGRVGGVMDPGQLAASYRRAATQGSLMLKNNLNKNGGINTDFTYGLNMQQAAVIGNNILANSSQYDEWMKDELARTARWKEGHQGEDESSEAYIAKRKKAKILTEDQIKSFRYGTSTTAEAVTSFNDHIKDFQKEMNGFVASVSKITGSFESAVDFIQDLTNGQAFSAGEKARKTREHAATVAANLRVMAGDAGMPVGAMYNIVKGMGGAIDAARGIGIDEQIVGDRSATANVATMAAAAFTQWKKANPNATADEQDKALYRFQSRAEGLAKGDAMKDNVLLAQLVAMKRISKERALELIESGDQRKVGNFLKSAEGFGVNADIIRNDRVYMDYLARKNSDVINEFNSAALDKGVTNEAIIYNQRNAIDIGKKVASSMLSGVVGHSVTSEIADIQKNAMLDEDTLRKAGLNDQQIEEAKKSRNMSTTSLRRRLVEKFGADEKTLNKEVSQKMVSSLRDKYGDKEGAKAAIDHFEEMVKNANPEATDDEIRRMVVSKEMDKKREQLNQVKIKVLESEGSDAKMLEAISAAAAGEGDTILNDVGFVENMLEGKFATMGLDSEVATKALATGIGRYHAARDAGMTVDDALKYVQDDVNKELEKNGVEKEVSGLDDKEQRRAAGERYVKTNAAAGLFDKMLRMSGMDEAGKETAKRRFMDNLRGMKFENVKRRAGESDEDYAQRVYASISKVAIEAALGDGKKTAALNPDDVTSEELRLATETNDAKDIVRKAYVGVFDTVDFDGGSLVKAVTKDQIEANRAEANDMKAAGGDMNFQNAKSRVNASNFMNTHTRRARKALGDKYTERLNRAIDSADAKERNRSFADIDDFDKKMIDAKLHMKDKMKFLSEMFEDPEGMVREKGNERTNQSLESVVKNGRASDDVLKRIFKVKDRKDISAKHIAALLKTKLSNPEWAAMNDEDFEKAFKEDKDLIATGLVDALYNKKDSSGKRKMSVRASTAAFIAGASVKEGEDRNEALQNGYRTQSMASGGVAVSIESLDYLRQIAKGIEELNNKNKDK